MLGASAFAHNRGSRGDTMMRYLNEQGFNPRKVSDETCYSVGVGIAATDTVIVYVFDPEFATSVFLEIVESVEPILPVVTL